MDAKNTIKKLASNEKAIEWSNDSGAEVDTEGDVWYNGHWAQQDELNRFAHWLDENHVR